VKMDPQDSNSQDSNPPADDQNGRRKSNRSPPYALFNLLVIVVAVIYGAYYQMYLSTDETAEVDSKAGEEELQRIPLFTASELKKFDGVSEYRSHLHSPTSRTSI
jgi:hypothetical protein